MHVLEAVATCLEAVSFRCLLWRALHSLYGRGYTYQAREQMVLHVVRETAELVRSPYVVVFLASGMPP